jgi:hypothetical protein
MILSGTRPANHHRLPAAGDCADQPRNRVFERHTIRAARAAAREPAWALAGDTAPGADGNLVTVDLDATIVIAHSERRSHADLEEDGRLSPDDRLRRSWRRRERGSAGHRAQGGERRVQHGRGHIEAAGLALAQLPRRLRRRVLVRADSGGGTHGFQT